MKKLLWHPLAEEDFECIIKYCKLEFGVHTAQKVVNRIRSSVGLLKTQPWLGHLDEELCNNNKQQEYRSLSCIHTRIIYSVHEEYIYIHLLWDNRQALRHLVEMIEERE